MDEKEILQRQVDALEKLLQIKEAIIQEQESKIRKLENEAISRQFIPMPPPMPPISIPSIWQVDPCTDGNLHEYPFPWHATTPPPCKKCGKVSHPSYVITSSNSVELKEPFSNEDIFATIDGINNKKGV